MDKLVTINLHGVLGEQFGKKYSLNVSSVGEAVHAINCLNNNKFYQFLIEGDKENLQYQVIVNNEAIEISKEEQQNIIENCQPCELNLPDKSLEIIDIVPVIEGGDSGLVATILGALLIIAGIIILVTPGLQAFAPLGYGLIIAGIGLLAAGIIYMLSSPPGFEDFRSGKRNNLFSGPDNITGEGGPIPLLYGRLIIGSQVISAFVETDRTLLGDDDGDRFWVTETDHLGSRILLTDNDGNLTPPETFYAPKQRAVVIDLLSEGPIDGLVETEYKYQGTVGRVGFDSVIDVPNAVNPSLGNSRFLRSIYYNQVPALSSDGNSNFQQLNIDFSLGGGDGQLFSSSRATDKDNELRVTRQISERLWYNDPKTNANIKFFRLYSPDIRTVQITLKLPTLYDLNDEGKFRNAINSAVIYYRPIYKTGGDTYDRVRQTGPGNSPEIAEPKFLTRKVEFNGTINVSGLTWTVVIDLPIAQANDRLIAGWEIKIERVNPEGVGDKQSPLFLDSITEIYKDIFSLPFSAVVRNEFRADYFAQIPARAYDVRGLKVKVPNNYDPKLRSYSAQLTHSDGSSQEWNGTFATNKVWTDNPAWCFYDLLTNKRYGLGRWISEESIDKWTLYLIGKYCDTMVSDGFGSVEPRFTCNTYIVNREQAYKVLNDFASIFNSIVYYGFGAIQVVQDSPKDPYLQFNSTNVEDGNFIYSSTSKKVRHTVALIRYNDPKNFFRPTTEYVEDIAGIQKYGYRQLDLSAYGCTSRGQAVRLGRWALLSENLETETISFTAGMDAAYLRPGDIFKIYDHNRKTSNLAGRLTNITSAATTICTLDREISLSDTAYNFSLLTPSYHYDPQIINANNIPFMAPQDVTGIRQPQIQKRRFNGSSDVSSSNGVSTITLTPPLDGLDYNTADNYVWLIEGTAPSTDISKIQQLTDSSFDYYRCIKVEEKDGFKYDVIGLQYVSGKFALIENGLNFERSFAEYGAIPASPTNANIDVSHGSTRFKVNYSFVVPDVSGISSFWVYANTIPFTGTGIPDRNYLVDVVPTTKRDGYFFPTKTGNYHLRIYSYNDEGRVLSSSFASGNALLEAPTNPIDSVVISTLQVDTFTGSYSGDVNLITTDDINPIFTWQLGTEGASTDLGGVKCRLTFRNPSSGIIPHPTIFKEATGISPSGRFEYTFDFEQNKNTPGGPYRNYSAVVEAFSETSNTNLTSAGNIFRPYRDENGWVLRKAGYKHILFLNPPITGVTLTSGGFQTGNFLTTGQIDALGGVNIQFLSGNLSSGIFGGWLWASTGVFDPIFARTGTSSTIFKHEFGWNDINRVSSGLNVPYVFKDFRIQSGFCSISFMDRFDAEHRKYNPSIYTGLDITNVVPIKREGGMNDFYITSQLNFSDFNRKENTSVVKMSGNSTNYEFGVLNSGGEFFTIFSYTGG